MKELDEIDQLFQTTFEGFESNPDPQVKVAIDRAIASKKKRRRLLFIWFPVWIGAAVLAGTLYFYSPSGKTQISGKQTSSQDASSGQLAFSSNNELQDQKTNDSALTNPSKETPSIHYLHSKEKTSGRNNTLLRSDLFDLSKSTSHSSSDFASPKDFSKERRNNAIVRQSQSERTPTTSIDQTVTESHKPEVLTPALAQTTDSTSERIEVIAAENNSQDSVTAITPEDSTTSTNPASLADKPELLLEPRVEITKWSLSVITGWENESKRPAERFDSLNLWLESSEFARIHSTSFYGKIEINRRITARLDVLTGLGFHSGRITQYGSLHTLDSTLVVESVSSTPPAVYAYFIRQQNESRSYQVHSIVLPLGIAYSVPLGESFGFRISGGTQLAYSWMSEKQSASPVTKPEFRPFGLNTWLRPEIHYNFGNFQVFGFGTFNQPLVRQLKWNFEARRNPAFGAGIGVLFRL